MSKYYQLRKSRELNKRKRINQSDTSDENEEPPEKLFDVSSAGSTSEFICSSDNIFKKDDGNFSDDAVSQDLEELPQLHSPELPLPELSKDFYTDKSCSSRSTNCSQEYDTDGRNEIEENFLINYELQANDLEWDENAETPKSTLREKLRSWANENVNNITRTSLDQLLQILRDHGHTELPKCAETLLGTQRTRSRVKKMKSKRGTDGSYIYTGIERVLKDKIDEQAFTENVIHLLINIDGLPMYNKSLIQLWPILVQILCDGYYCKPFVAGMFCGDSKPASASEFLEDFVEECCKLIEEGFVIGNTIYKVQIDAFVCDTPARSFIKCTKGHSGFYSCERCEIRGKTINGKRVFPQTNCTKRTKATFTARRKTKQQQQHHQPNRTSPLIRIPQFDPVRQVILDYMHLLCNGVIKALLERWTGKKKNRAKLGRLARKQLSNILSSLKGSIPTEFQRKTFELEDIANWKATQYRFFLLYAGPFVLKPVLPTKYYRNFIRLSFASRILCHPTMALTCTDIADNLLQRFFSELPDLYGENIQVINFHNVIHLADDVRQLKVPLTHYSAFPFENLLGILKRLIRTPNNPLQQIFRRLSEIYYSSKIMRKIPGLSNRVEIAQTNNQIDYSDLKLRSFHISVKEPNNIVELDTGAFVQVQRIFCDSKDINDVFIEGQTLKKKDIFDYLISSPEVGLHMQTSISPSLRKYSVGSIVRKCFRIVVEESTYLVSLLHE